MTHRAALGLFVIWKTEVYVCLWKDGAAQEGFRRLRIDFI